MPKPTSDVRTSAGSEGDEVHELIFGAGYKVPSLKDDPEGVVSLRSVLAPLSLRARTRVLWRVLRGRDFVLLGPGPPPGERQREPIPDLTPLLAPLPGRRITQALYYTLSYEVPTDWDFGTWHDVGWGVELRSDDGTTFTFLAHPEYGVRIISTPFLMTPGLFAQERAPLEWDVTHHPKWRPLLAGPVEVAEVVHQDITEGAERLTVPIAIHLTTRAGAAWIVASQQRSWNEDAFDLPADSLVAVFSVDPPSFLVAQPT